MNSVHNPDTGLYGPFIKISIPSLLITAVLQYRPFTFGSPIRDKVWGCTTNQHLTGMHFQNDDEKSGCSKSTAERGLREELLRHFVPVNMLSERTVERMKKMEGRRRQGLVVNYCNECNYMTQNKSDLVKHSRAHSKEKPFQCELCDQKFSLKSSLKVHIMSHKGGRFQCEECAYKAAQKSILLIHLLTHSGVKPHKCDSCKFSTATKGNLIAHQRSHSGEKPYACTRCSYKSAHSSHLTVHTRKHTGVKPYACSECSYQAAQKGHINSHTLTHSGAKPFQCEHCSYRTGIKGSLTRHLKICKHTSGPSA